MTGVALGVEIVGRGPVDLDALEVSHRVIGVIDTGQVERRAGDWPAELLVWADVEPPSRAVTRRFPRLVSALAQPVFHTAFDPRRPTPLPWSFQCNVCGSRNERTDLPRTRSCQRCLSNVRYRATADALTRHVFGGDVALCDVPRRLDVRVLGIGDWPPLARRLAATFDYVNTHLDAEPRLDLTGPLPDALVGQHDVVVAGDVLEHVAPPLERAMENLLRLPCPGGAAIVTVPWAGNTHVEHFPQLHCWELRHEAGGAVLVNERRDGTVERFGDLVFHGPGRSLEMRVFTKQSLLAALGDAGFGARLVCDDPGAHHGIVHLPGQPVPVIAYAPPARDVAAASGLSDSHSTSYASAKRWRTRASIEASLVPLVCHGLSVRRVTPP